MTCHRRWTSAAFGLKVRTVVSLYLWDLFRTRARGEPGREGVRRTCRHTAYRRARHVGMLMHMDVCSGYRPAPRTAK